MSDESSTPARYWLMTGSTPTGPFTTAEVHARLADGTAAWDTPACPVGGSEWAPLLETPGFGPAATPPSSAAALTSPAPAAVTPPTAGTMATEDRWAAAIGIGVLVLGVVVLAALGYGLYEWTRAPTATEVCERVVACETPAAMAPYVTPRFGAFMDDTFTQSPNDEFELTHEFDGPNATTRHVGFRGAVLVPEVGRRVRMEGYFRVVQSDGWKVDDLYMTHADGAALGGPASLVEDHEREKAAKRPGGVTKSPVPPTNRGLRGWFDGLSSKSKTFLAVVLVLAVGAGVRSAWVARRAEPNGGTPTGS